MKSRNSVWLDALLVAAIFGSAAFLRLYRLDQLPPGLHYDEAFNATMAQHVLTGVERPIFFSQDLTEEPLAIYVTALSFAIFGASPFSLRLVSAFAGIAGVVALYVLARAVFRSRGVGALAAGVLAILYWHVNFSRLGMEPIFAPLMMTLCVLFLWRGLCKPGVHSAVSGVRCPTSNFQSSASAVTRHVSPAARHFILAGLFLAATQYTYKAALFFPGVIAAVLVTEILLDRTILSRFSRPFALFAFVAFLAFMPLGLYFAAHPSEFLERPNSVAISPAALSDNAVQVAGMFFVRGDANPRSNLPDRPALDPFLAIGFVAGIIACIANWRRREARVILLWLVVMVLPSVFTDFAPHFGRSIGATPAIALAVAYGFKVLFGIASHQKSLRITYYVLFSLGLTFSAVSTYRDYFDIWGARTGNFDSFDVGILQLGQKLAARPADERIYFTPTENDHYTIRFGLNGRAAAGFDARRALVLPPGGERAAYGILTRDDARTLARLTAIYPSGAITDRIFDFTNQPYAVIFRATGAPQIAPQNFAGARFGDEIEMLGYDWTRDGEAIALTIYWESIAETRADFTTFVHLSDATSGQVWAQDDARPGRGTYPTPRWRTGEIVMDEYRLALPRDLPRGEYQIGMGLYVLETGVRVPVTDARGVRMENDRVLSRRLSLP
ncbi:MAG: glycosyltransferase family 39 protein [Chloroflexi bacterium]|nr:glycosyltransferase family 39 protein [Chloroflexota bacterium]